MISIKQKGNFDKTNRFLGFLYRRDFYKVLDSYGRAGVQALSSATPVNTGETARDWYYEIHMSQNSVRIIWSNSNMTEGIPVAILVQYGHATGNGYWVEGNDFINPAMRDIFDGIAEAVWEGVRNA